MPKPSKPKRVNAGRTKTFGPVLVVMFIALLSVAASSGWRPRATEAELAGAAVIREVSNDDIVLVAAPTRNIAKGEKLGGVPFTTIKWPKSRLTTDYLLDLKDHTQAIAATALPKYLPVPLAGISDSTNEGNQVTERIPQGMRAITVRVDAESAVEGWAQSGNFVDVILVRAGREAAGGLESKVIAENVRILSAGRSAESLAVDHTAPNPPSTVTLLVDQEAALKIKTAASLGKLAFALRGSGDQLPTTTTRIDQRTLIGAAKGQGANPAFAGTARGPDGQLYVLNTAARWTKSDALPPLSADRAETAQ